MKTPVSLRLYAAATALADPLTRALLKRRLERGKEDAFRLDERRGLASFDRPPGPLAWLHGASVGESVSHLPLVERFVRERPDITLLVTSGTVTSAELMARRLPKGVFHQYAPVDPPQATKRFVEHWRPDLAIFVESEIWPNLLLAAREVGSKLALMSARLSDKSARGWDRLPAAARRLFGLFDLVTVQDARTGDWIAGHGGEVEGRLDLKRYAEPLPADTVELDLLRTAVAGRRVLVAASTHEGEEALVGDVVRGLADKPLLVVAPRHPERGAEVAGLLAEQGFAAVSRRAAGEALTGETQAYVADTLGELGLFYRIADVVVLGGSFVDGLTGHNPLEPARLGKAIVTGAGTASFADTYAALAKARAALVAHDARELGAAVAALIAEPALARALGERARRASAEDPADFDAAWAALQALLPPAP
jgi:3-deoxy-D-manno-octulosonic-acid transferase